MNDYDEIRYPEGFSLKDILAWGSFGLVCLDSTSNTVVKSAHDAQTQPFIDAEKRIYERLDERGGHAGVLKYFGAHDESSIRLQYAAKNDLRTYFHHHASTVSMSQRRKWTTQIVEALEFVHRVGVVHGDLTCANVLLDEDLNAKVADFSGSSLDGSPLLVHVTASHAHPVYAGSVKGDLFALGSLLYQIVTGKPPYSGLTDRQIEDRYAKGEFPVTDTLGVIGNVIRGRWEGKYDNASIIVEDVRGTRIPTSYLWLQYQYNNIFSALRHGEVSRKINAN